MVEAMRILLDVNEIEAVSVRDHAGTVHPLSVSGHRPRPFCADCQREVLGMCGVIMGPAMVFMVECHGELDVVRFVDPGDGTVTAVPCFDGTEDERADMLQWVKANATDSPVIN